MEFQIHGINRIIPEKKQIATYMKEYKFKINGNAYKVAVESVQDGIAAVIGERYPL